MGTLIRFPLERRKAQIVERRSVLSFPQAVGAMRADLAPTYVSYGGGWSPSETAARPMGSCTKCGHTLYENLVHSCPTSVRIESNGQFKLTFPAQPGMETITT